MADAGGGPLPVRIVEADATGPSPMPVREVAGAMTVRVVEGESGPSGIPVIVVDGTGPGAGGIAVSGTS